MKPILANNDIVHCLLASFPDTLAVYWFGSFSAGDEHPKSDLDLALFPVAPLDPVARWEAVPKMAQIAGRDVDLVDLLSASTVIRMQVVAHGRRLYAADENQVGRFEDRVFSDYARLNGERRGILETIQQTGTVYGR